MNRELSNVQLVLEKAVEPEIKLPTSTGSLKKQESCRKTSFSALLTMPKPLTVGSQKFGLRPFKKGKFGHRDRHRRKIM